MSARVLIADDSAVVRALLRRQLGEMGFEIVEAGDGQEALDLARSTDPDVILLDLEMPGLDGMEVLAALKADGSLEHVPVVFVTAREDATDAVAALEQGAHDYLRKPFAAPELRARVQAAARMKQLQDELREANAALELQACTDALTGIYNRRFLDAQLARAISRAERHGRPVAALLLDIDHFKRINDDFGHQTGDAVLMQVAARLGKRLRREDLLGRWGGEEFMVIAADTEPDGAETLAESLREEVCSAPVTFNGESIDVTASVGWSSWNGDSTDELVKRADRALYEAKGSGRNAVRGG